VDFFETQAPDPNGGADAMATSDAPVKDSLLQRVRQTSRGVFEKWGVQWKRGPGHPRLDGEPKANDVPLNAPPTALPVGGGPGAALGGAPGRSGIVRRTYKSLAKAFSGWADKIIFRKTVELTGDKTYAKELVLETSLTDPEAEAFGELIDELAGMFGADEKFMALAASVATVTAVGGRYVVVIRDLEKQLAVKRKLEKQLHGAAKAI
jgi:hypothetical protein